LSALLALVAAVAFGLSDFAAGLLSRRASVFVVTVIGQSTSTVLTWIATLAVGGAAPGASLAWGAVAGIGSVGGSLFLYRGLARGRMSVVGPVSALVTALGSATAGIVMGDRPSVAALVGIAVACAAVTLVSTSDDSATGEPAAEMRRSLVDAVAAGLGFVLFFIALHRAGTNAGLWPVAMSQSTGLVLALCFAAGFVVTGRLHPREARRVFPAAMSVGVLGGGATIAYFAATHSGLLSVTAVITSLYPAATVVPAMLVLHEQTRPSQTVGLVLAALAVALLAL